MLVCLLEQKGTVLRDAERFSWMFSVKGPGTTESTSEVFSWFSVERFSCTSLRRIGLAVNVERRSRIPG